MARKADDLLADLDELGSEEQQQATSASKAKKESTATSTANDEDDAFAEIEKQLKAKPAATSRPTTPRLNSTTTSTTNRSPKRSAEYTPASTSVGSSERNSSEDRARANAPAQSRASGEGSRSYHQAQTPAADDAGTESQQEKATSGGGWWGSMFSAASAAVKQAETIAKEIRGNEEAQKWADQVRGQYQNLQSLGTDLRTRALPTFTSLISHIAPPISAHERLQIHTTHDIQNYPSLDPLIYATFSRIMSQVEGGDLLVIQRGSESRNRSASEAQQGYKGGVLGSSNPWTEGPWWREETSKRSLGAVPGLKEGTRLARVSAESYAKDFFDSRGGLEEAAKKATETLNESNPTRSSDIFLAIQAISYQVDKNLFADNSTAEKDNTILTPQQSESEDHICFAIYLHDPIHSISFKSLSQPFPQKWADWLDASASEPGALPESIMEIIQSGGVDPREWVAEWMEEILSLGVGVVAQQYVAKRMGVGEGGIGRGKMREVDEEVNSGEAARAGVI